MIPDRTKVNQFAQFTKYWKKTLATIPKYAVLIIHLTIRQKK